MPTSVPCVQIVAAQLRAYQINKVKLRRWVIGAFCSRLGTHCVQCFLVLGMLQVTDILPSSIISLEQPL